ncbi:MAG: bifunctional phosphopantothenoylcysteine decarboxylase/phosphopantothenate--cysteine ligase CoaBC [Rhodospirillales bacterium]|nr:bifunctional phosphopantothenoylcysteine decarboxylase/phosphopantothenate--cysteine ligase CoaBC [Rhodospirillales bacterium]MDE0380647.1 bifunctional phosphopantothenoylcysteine decarboxylase/phosphopantothenate--cysteine ligase CoaBC [Rhodospirillales bacterium]
MTDVENDGGADTATLGGKQVLLVIAGGIAAYKCLDLIRRLREAGAGVRCILTRAGAAFVTPLSVETLTGETVFTDTLALTDDSEIAHIRLGQEADIVVVAPATADIMARMAHGIADDLATSTLLAADKPVLVAPAMNTRMWDHPATERNRARLEADGVRFVGPNDGPLAEGESGPGRMAEVPEIVEAIADVLSGTRPRALAGLRVLVTSGPTYEPIDPVRFLGNRSSGKQGHAIAAACADAGAAVLLVSGPTQQPAPAGVETVRIETAEEMLAACQQGLPADIAICAAAVSDWRAAAPRQQKIKKPRGGGGAPTLELTENPDILARLGAAGPERPRLVIGFAAETEDLEANAAAKLAAKGCDWILANRVAEGAVFGDDENDIHLLTREEDGAPPAVERWPRMSKAEVAARLVARIAQALSTDNDDG